jgi:hypothetical protein
LSCGANLPEPIKEISIMAGIKIAKTSKHRNQSLEPGDRLVDQVIKSNPAGNPLGLVTRIIGGMGYDVVGYDRACVRAERFVKNNKDCRRMPTHIKDKFVLMRIVEKCVAKQFSESAPDAGAIE